MLILFRVSGRIFTAIFCKPQNRCVFDHKSFIPGLLACNWRFNDLLTIQCWRRDKESRKLMY